MEATTAGDARSQWAELAYEAIAPVYDDFTAHHDYELWLGNLLPELERHGLRRGHLLDVGCGTGKSFIPMLERGWEVTACDISASMVELARAKVGEAAALSIADMRDLPAFGEFDLVWALDDAVNYLLSAEELEQALSGMRVNLAPGGLLMFDVNTLGSYRTFFAETQVVEANGRRLTWRGRGSADTPPRSISEASFEVEILAEDVDREEIRTEMHRQRHFPEEEVLALMERADLECLEVFGHGFDAVLEQPMDDLVHTKAVYLARRAE
ncbi:MAG TPA: class I SAM-dependent methyltransferase [Solirubrobacterales bacterium]|nr:class I SAM-dependent methyltransferase [Solirubrobacterales bacterium]